MIYKFAIILFVILPTFGCTRKIQDPEPQQGPLIGRWEYAKQIKEKSCVLPVAIGDSTWLIPSIIEFFPDGTVTRGFHESKCVSATEKQSQMRDWGQEVKCHFYILSPSTFKVTCGRGSSNVSYSINGNDLELDFFTTGKWHYPPKKDQSKFTFHKLI